MHLSISNDIVSTKIYDKRDDFDFEIVNFPFLDGDGPRSTSYGVFISQLIRFARASSYVTDSVGLCVIPCAFFGKVSNILFLVEKCVLFKQKDVYNFSLAF